MEPNQIFTVNIVINATNVTTAQCWIEFDPTILTAIKVENGDMFVEDGGFVLFNNGTIDNNAGQIRNIWGLSTIPLEGGIFATITFQAKNVIGVSPIRFITDSTFIPPYDVVFNNATVDVRYPPVIMEIQPNYNYTGNWSLQYELKIDPNTNNITTLNCSLYFDPTVISCQGVSNGGMFTTLFNATWDNSIGVINIVAAELVGIGYPGTLAIINFAPVKTGISQIEISYAKIINDEGVILDYQTINGTMEVDLTPPEINIIDMHPIAFVDNLTFIRNPFNIDVNVVDDHLATVMGIAIEPETWKFLYVETYQYETMPSNYNLTWTSIYSLCNHTISENNVTVIYQITDMGEYFVVFGLYNETGGMPSTPAVAIFDPATLQLIAISSFEGVLFNITFNVSKFLPANLIGSPDAPPIIQNTTTIFTVTPDFRLEASIPYDKEHWFVIRAVDKANNENSSFMVVFVDNTPPVITKAIGSPSYGSYITSSTPIWINVTDAGLCPVGLFTIHYIIWNETGIYNEGTSHENVTIYIGEECEHTIEYWVEDALGNTAETQNITLYVDNIPPFVSLLVGQPKYTANNKTYVTTSTPFNITAKDNKSGIAVLQYRIWYYEWSAWQNVTNFTLSGEGKHYIEIKAIDNLGNAIYHNKTFYVDITPPETQINLQGKIEEGKYKTNVLVTLEATDESGISEIRYRVDRGNWATYSVPFTVSTEGIHLIEYYAVDNVGNTEAIKTKTFEILKNKPPVASFSYTPSEPTDLDTINFFDNSTDPDGEIVKWHWDFGDGNISEERNPTHKYADDGIYVVTLTVTDNEGATDMITKQISVANSPPTVAITYQPEKPKLKEEITFTSIAKDADGDIVNYTWYFGDGNVSYEKNPTHVYGKEGNYTVKLIVTDDDGATAQTTVTITIIKPKIPLLPYIAIIVALIIIAIIVVIVWRKRTK